MSYHHLVMQRESAWEILNEIGDISSLHFVDPNPNVPLINRPFSNQIKRCDEVLNKITFIEQQMKKFKRQIVRCQNYNLMIAQFKKLLNQRLKAGHTFFEDIETDIQDKVNWL